MRIVILLAALVLAACGGTPPPNLTPPPGATVKVKVTEKDAGVFMYEGATNKDESQTGSTGTAEVSVQVKDGVMAIRVTAEGKLSYARNCVYKSLSGSFASGTFGSNQQYQANIEAQNGKCELPDAGM